MLLTKIRNITAEPIFLPLSLLTLLWLVTFFRGITTAIDVWSVSEIFTHCFLVLPCSFYFIFVKRHELNAVTWQPNYWLLPLFVFLLMFQLFAELGDIKLFMHFATFSALPVLIWMFFGNAVLKVILFPLFFMLFAIPVGEQLIPFLQDITTNMAVPLIELSQVPIFRNGYYLDIPQGRFLVAEACSGISFLIASIVFGCFYAYLSFSRFYKQVIFVAISIFLPIFANAVRVYGIVLTAYLTDMEYAAGADHLIYGGVFYSIIIFMLIVIGEKFRDKEFIESKHETSESLTVRNSYSHRSLIKILTVLFAAIAIQQLWKYSVISNSSEPWKVAVNLERLSVQHEEKVHSDWKPSFHNASISSQGSVLYQDKKKIDYYISVYASKRGELISSENSLFNVEKWSILSSEKLYVPAISSDVKLMKLVSAQGHYRYAITWYQLNGINYVSKIKLKLLQAFELFIGKQPATSIIAFSIQGEEQANRELLTRFIKENAMFLSTVVNANIQSEK